jgi:hypothetical protein
MGLEHPTITRIRRTGYPYPEPTGTIDIYGDELMVGERYWVDPDGEIIHEDNLYRYLKEHGYQLKEE